MVGEEFVKKIWPAAKDLENKGGVSAVFTVAQAALESGWGKLAIGKYNIFGMTKGSSWKGATELVLTTEYFSTGTRKFTSPEKIVSVKKINNQKYKYTVYRLFRKYNSFAEALADHELLFKKDLYSDAWPYRKDPEEFSRRISDKIKAKYATDPNYDKTMISMIQSVRKRLTLLNLK